MFGTQFNRTEVALVARCIYPKCELLFYEDVHSSNHKSRKTISNIF